MNCSLSATCEDAKVSSDSYESDRSYNQLDHRVIERVIVHVPSLLYQIEQIVDEGIIEHTLESVKRLA